MLDFLKGLTAKTALLALWGSGVVAVALYLFVADRGNAVPPELGMAFGGMIAFVTGGVLAIRERN